MYIFERCVYGDTFTNFPRIYYIQYILFFHILVVMKRKISVNQWFTLGMEILPGGLRTSNLTQVGSSSSVWVPQQCR